MVRRSPGGKSVFSFAYQIPLLFRRSRITGQQRGGSLVDVLIAPVFGVRLTRWKKYRRGRFLLSIVCLFVWRVAVRVPSPGRALFTGRASSTPCLLMAVDIKGRVDMADGARMSAINNSKRRPPIRVSAGTCSIPPNRPDYPPTGALFRRMKRSQNSQTDAFKKHTTLHPGQFVDDSTIRKVGA